MKHFKLLIIAFICGISTLMSSCDLVEDAKNNSITTRWVASEEFRGYTIYYIYEFDYNDTYTYEELEINDGGGEVTNFYAYGMYEFSNYNEELILYPEYPYYESDKTYIYDAFVKNKTFQIKEEYDDGYWYWTKYYRD